MEPLTFRAGDTVEWTKKLPEFHATDYTLKYKLIGANGISPEIVATADGIDYDITIDAEDSDLAAGTYTLTGWVEDGEGFYKTVFNGSVDIEPNLREATEAVDTREFWQKYLDALQAMLLNRASVMQHTMTVPGAGSRMVQYLSPSEIYAEIAKATAKLEEIENDNRVANGQSRKQIKIQFNPTH